MKRIKGKKVMAVILTAAMALSMMGCGGSDTKAET